MNGLQTLIDQWTRITSSGDLTLYSNDQIALPSFIVIDPTPAIVSLEVFRALGYAPPFADQMMAETAMEHLAAMGGSAAIPGILAQGTPTPVAPVPTGVAGFGLAPEPPIVHELIDGLEDNDSDPDPQVTTQPTIDAHADPLPTPEPMIVTPIAAPIVYPTADDHADRPHSAALAKLDALVKLLESINPVADDLRTSIATMVVDSISNGPIVTAAPDTRSMPSIARSTKADGFKWYLMIGPLASLTEEQAIEQQTNLLRAAKFTRTPKLDPPGDNDVEGFGEVWYSPISASQAERLAWMDGTQLPVHNM